MLIKRFKFAERLRGRESVKNSVRKSEVKRSSSYFFLSVLRFWFLNFFFRQAVFVNIYGMANVMKFDFKDRDRFNGQNYDVWAYRVKIIF